MAAGTVILLIALIDEWVLQWRGRAPQAAPGEVLHNE